jgi:hypothetical protein
MKRTSTSLGSLGIGLDLPLRADVPAEHDTVRRLVGKDARPPALAAVDPSVVDVAADARLEHRLGDVDAEHVVLARLDPVEVLDEHGERALDRGFDDDRRPDGRLLCLRAHETSSGALSTASL